MRIALSFALLLHSVLERIFSYGEVDDSFFLYREPENHCNALLVSRSCTTFHNGSAKPLTVPSLRIVLSRSSVQAFASDDLVSYTEGLIAPVIAFRGGENATRDHAFLKSVGETID